jgi:hypothetical protein
VNSAGGADLDDFVLFELPNAGMAARLCAHLASRHVAWHEPSGGLSFVRVLLNPDDFDLACLLRTVQEWLDLSKLSLLRFQLDKRVYWLATPEALVAAG